MNPGILIHYGSRKYIPSLVNPIKNDKRLLWKPQGGIWTSPINSICGWKDYCESADFEECIESNSFKLILHEESRLFVVNSLKDLERAPIVYECGVTRFLDFERLAKDYDAIWLTEKGLHATRLSYPLGLYGWDCESVLIMNPNCCWEC